MENTAKSTVNFRFVHFVLTNIFFCLTVIEELDGFNPSCPGLPELRQTLGWGRSALLLRYSKKMVEYHFFQSLP